jgi:hypothetical protein
MQWLRDFNEITVRTCNCTSNGGKFSVLMGTGIWQLCEAGEQIFLLRAAMPSISNGWRPQRPMGRLDLAVVSDFSNNGKHPFWHRTRRLYCSGQLCRG